jgi:hypothetical protein
MVKRSPKTSKRRIRLRAVLLYQKLRAIQAAGMDYVNESVGGRKQEFLRGRYELCDALNLAPWQAFPLECDQPYPFPDDNSYFAQNWKLGWAARCALEHASR